MIMGIFVCANCDSLICSNRVYPIGTFLKAGSRCCDGVRTTLIVAHLAAAQAAIKNPRNWNIGNDNPAPVHISNRGVFLLFRDLPDSTCA